jgi:hypothetical protein
MAQAMIKEAIGIAAAIGALACSILSLWIFVFRILEQGVMP